MTDIAAAAANALSNNDKTEEQKMLDGEFYQAFDSVLLQQRQRAKELCFQYNRLSPLETEKRHAIIRDLFGKSDDSNANLENTPDLLPSIWVESPFHVDYGIHLHVGKNFYANHGCSILDCNEIRVGDNCLLAPHVCTSAATHPVYPTLRAQGAEYTAPITIGHNCWIGANATICPGITLGNNVVVGAGAVVTKSFKDNVVIGGVPARVLREIHEGDKNEMTSPQK